MLFALIALALFGLIFLPQVWVGSAMRRHAADRPDLPGAGGELARHLLDRAGLQDVPVEMTEAGDHYDPLDRVVRLSAANHDGRSVTAVAVAAHEVAHALQHAGGEPMFMRRHRLVSSLAWVEKIAVVILLSAPLLAGLLKAPALLALQLGVGFLMLASRVAVHAVTLPVEVDASFNKALPILDQGGYLPPDDVPAARQVLRAAAFTYVAAALVSLVDVARWLRILRF
jgi:Zn-dependent membrane protease YugP